MKKIISLLFASVILSNIILAAGNDNENYEVNNLIGIAFGITCNDSITFHYLELRDQICYEIKDFPIIPYIEPNIFISLTNKKPKLFYSVLFGIKKNIIERHGMIFSVDMGSGIAAGINDKDNAGVIGRVGFDIAYKNMILRCIDINLMSGFPFKGIASIGLAYKF